MTLLYVTIALSIIVVFIDSMIVTAFFCRRVLRRRYRYVFRRTDEN